MLYFNCRIYLTIDKYNVDQDRAVAEIATVSKGACMRWSEAEPTPVILGSSGCSKLNGQFSKNLVGFGSESVGGSIIGDIDNYDVGNILRLPYNTYYQSEF